MEGRRKIGGGEEGGRMLAGGAGRGEDGMAGWERGRNARRPIARKKIMAGRVYPSSG